MAAARDAAAATSPRHARYGSRTNPRVRMPAPASRAVSRVSAACTSQLCSRPASRRDWYSRRKAFTASGSRRQTCSRSPGATSALMPIRLSAAAKSSDARRSPCQSVRAARSPCRDAACWNDASKSSRTSPVDAPVAPDPMAPASSSTTRMPADANDAAQAAPVSPPPTMTTSVVVSPRCLGYEGRRVWGSDRSSKVRVVQPSVRCGPACSSFLPTAYCQRPTASCPGFYPRSASSSLCFRPAPQRYPPGRPSARTTRWQGTTSATGFVAQARATARAAEGRPIRRAISW
jgi:hypothetical protein